MDGGTTDGCGAADGGGGAADGGAADGGAAGGGGGVRPGPEGRCWHGDGDLLNLADGDGVPIFREPLGGTRRHFLVYTIPPATVSEKVLADVPVESAWLADVIKELDGRSYIGFLDRTSVAFTLGCAVQQAIRVHVRTLIRPPTNPRTKRISLNAAIAAVGPKNCHKMVNWDGVEVNKLAPAFVSDSKNVAIITEWKTRSEASSRRLRRGRGRDGQPVVPAPRPSELPLDWWYDKELLSGLSNMKLPGGTKLDGTMPDKTWWLLAAAHNALWLTVTRRLPLDAACEPLSNIPIQQMFRMGRLPFLEHPLKKEWT